MADNLEYARIARAKAIATARELGLPMLYEENRGATLAVAVQQKGFAPDRWPGRR